MSSTNTPTDLYIAHPCKCEICTKLRTCFSATSQAVDRRDERAEVNVSLLQTAVTLGDVLEQLHRQHRSEVYLTAAGVDAALVPVNQAATSHEAQDQRSLRKFLVCDHCMAHGLTCNEASVCEQCISFGQPCIHRWCRYSQSSIDSCERGKCHYAHMDSIPHEEGEAKWIILKGDLPAHLSRGRLAPRSVEAVEGDVEQKELMDVLNARQMDAIRMFYEAATTDRDIYAKNSVQCGCNLVGSEV